MSQLPTIRRIRVEDNPTLAHLIRQVFEEHHAPKQGTVYSDPTTDQLFELFQTPKSVLWVCEVSDQPMGCCGIFPTPGLDNGVAELVKFYLTADARGKGIGKQLLDKSIQSAIELGYTHIYLESLPDFAKAIRLYEKTGFVRLTEPLGNSGHTSCNIWMVKSLANE